MAVTITVAELTAALRLNDTAEETAEVTRLLAYATEAVTQHAPDASETAMNEAVRRLSGYLFDHAGSSAGRRLRQRLEELGRGQDAPALPPSTGAGSNGRAYGPGCTGHRRLLICQPTVESPST